MDYKDTLLMPKTDFSMRGNLPENEKIMRDNWTKLDLYNKIVEKNKENKSKADEVHVSDGLGELFEVSEQLTEEEIEKAAEEAKQAVEDAKKQKHH